MKRNDIGEAAKSSMHYVRKHVAFHFVGVLILFILSISAPNIPSRLFCHNPSELATQILQLAYWARYFVALPAFVIIWLLVGRRFATQRKSVSLIILTLTVIIVGSILLAEFYMVRCGMSSVISVGITGSGLAS